MTTVGAPTATPRLEPKPGPEMKPSIPPCNFRCCSCLMRSSLRLSLAPISTVTQKRSPHLATEMSAGMTSRLAPRSAR
jgi:hypothetical protein